MGSKITIIGAGSVGSTIAHILSLKPYVSELVMIDILKDKADGEIMDMAQGTGYRVAAFGAAVFCCIGGIILVFYNEKKINGIINRHQ